MDSLVCILHSLLKIDIIQLKVSGRARKIITIKEIAEKVGVSSTTVANVIHGNYKKVSAETVGKIQTVLEELHYIPNMGARLLVKNESKIIGIILNYPRREEKNAIQDPFNAELIGAMEASIRQNGYFTMLYAAQDPEDILNTATTWNFDGMIILGVHEGEWEELMRKMKKPVVFIDCYFEQSAQSYVNIGLDDFGGGYQMTRYLIQRGHKRIAFLADEDPPRGVDLERLNGYRKAMEEARLADWAEFIPISPKISQRMIDFQRLYRRRGDFTALFFASDYYAVGAMNYFYDRGVLVPRDISIAGFDDIYYAKIIRPMLTTIRQDISKKGQLAVRQLLSLIGNGYAEEEKIRLPVELIERDTVASL